MPFTTSHPAIVLPLKTIWPKHFSLTGLMAGAMAPDLLYFLIATTVPRGISHSWSGLFLFCLPAGILFAFAFHWLFKYHFIRNLPAPWDRRFPGLAASSWKPGGLRWWCVFLSSILVGVLSHFFWDACTHAEGEIASRIPYLVNTVSVMGREIQIVRLAQHLSTLVGAAIIVVWATKGQILPTPCPNYVSRAKGSKLRFWIGIGVASILFTGCVPIFYKIVFPSLEIGLGRTIGLASWAGLFWVTGVYSVAKGARHE